MIDDKTRDKIHTAMTFVARTLDIPEDDLDPDSSMENTPAWDSFAHMTVCLALEKRFGVKLTMDNITSATSIRALATLIP